MAFKAGQSGNPGGKSHLRQLTNDLRKVVAQSPAKVRAISEYIVDQAAGGDLDYIQFLYDRLDGKAAQTVEIENNVNVTMDDHRTLLSELRKKTRDRTAIDLTPLIGQADGD